MASAGKSAQKPSAKSKPPAIKAEKQKSQQYFYTATSYLNKILSGSLADRLAPKKSTSSNTEDQPKKKGPLKPSTTFSLLIEQLPVSGSAAGTFFVFCLLLLVLAIYIPGQDQARVQVERVGLKAEKQLQLALERAQSSIDTIALQSQVVARLNNNKRFGQGVKVKNLEDLLTSGIPHSTALQIYPREIGSEQSLSMGFAALDIVRRTLEGKATRVEAAHSGNKWQILACSPVYQDGRIIGAVLLSLGLPYVKEPLEFPEPSIGQIKVFQSHEIVGDPIFSSGQPTLASDYSWKTTLPGTAWTIAFNPSESFLEESSRPIWPLLLVMMTGLTAIAGAAVYATIQVRRKAGEDFSVTLSILKKLISGIADESGSFHFLFAQNTADSIIQLFVGQLPDISKGSQKLPKNQQKRPSTPGKDMKFDARVLEKMQAEDAEKIPAAIFRAYDIRGVVGKSLTDSAVTLIGQAIASEAHARNEKTIIVANDSRLSSPTLKASLIQGLVASGCNVISIGAVPTPVLYFATHVLDAHSGVMITGSRSAPNYNGLKIILGGHRLAGDEITDLYRRIVESDFTIGQGSVSTEEIISRYQKHVLNDVVLPRPLKVVVDCGNGVAAKIAPCLFEQLGCEVIHLYCTADGTFPYYNPDQSKTASNRLEKLAGKVKNHKADMGFSIDGDGDRVGFVTNAGKVIYPDQLLMLLSRDVLSRNPGANIVFDVKSTRHLSSLIKNCGGRPVLWKSGHSFIKQKMVETNALLAGEMSGHIFFKERWFGFDDGIYSAVRIAEALANEADAAEMVFKALPSAESTSEFFVATSEANKFGLIERLKKEGEFDDASITTIDGVRVDFTWGWGLVRASDTTSALTLRFEADDNEGLDRIKTLFKTQLLALDPELKIQF